MKTLILEVRKGRFGSIYDGIGSNLIDFVKHLQTDIIEFSMIFLFSFALSLKSQKCLSFHAQLGSEMLIRRERKTEKFSQTVSNTENV